MTACLNLSIVVVSADTRHSSAFCKFQVASEVVEMKKFCLKCVEFIFCAVLWIMMRWFGTEPDYLLLSFVTVALRLSNIILFQKVYMDPFLIYIVSNSAFICIWQSVFKMFIFCHDKIPNQIRFGLAFYHKWTYARKTLANCANLLRKSCFSWST